MLLIWLLACTSGDVPSALNTTPERCDQDSFAIASTTDYSVGALAVFSLDTLESVDTLAPTSGDPAVSVSGCAVFQLNRGAGDGVRRYEAGEWASPRWEVALESGDNAHDAVQIDDSVWLSLYGRNELQRRSDVDGSLLGTVDLSAYADSDGRVEADGLVRLGDRLYVALQGLDRTDGWSSQAGWVVAIDPFTSSVVDAWETGPNPKLFAHPAEPGTLVVLTGVYFEPDGGLFVLRPDGEGLSSNVLSERDLGADWVSYAEGPNGRAMLISAAFEGAPHQVHCLDWSTTEWVHAEQSGAFLSSVAVNKRGEAWVAARRSWLDDPSAERGLLRFDVGSCERVGASLSVTLDPYDVDFY